MGIFDGFKQIDDKTLYDLKFYRQTKWYAWGRCLCWRMSDVYNTI